MMKAKADSCSVWKDDRNFREEKENDDKYALQLEKELSSEKHGRLTTINEKDRGM